MKPIIGVIPLTDSERASLWMVPGYMNGIEEAGGVPVMLALTEDEDTIERMMSVCQGFLFTGGHDISPTLYGAAAIPQCGEISPVRDVMEPIILKRALAEDKPVFGICRGIQLINAVLGGTLYQDLPTELDTNIEHHQTPPYDIPVHEVEIIKDTPLYELLGKSRLNVNSYHHQAVRRLSSELMPMAYAPDGLVEAVYRPESKFAWAVQWHPEFSYKRDAASLKLFRCFVDNCK